MNPKILDRIEEMYLAEAVRRTDVIRLQDSARLPLRVDECRDLSAFKAHARTLKELGWKPPIDEARMAKARKVAVAVKYAEGQHYTAAAIERGDHSYGFSIIQAVYDALGED